MIKEASLTIEPAGVTDFPLVLELLRSVSLTTAGLTAGMDLLYVARRAGHIVGCAALEMYGETALLRSVAVSPDAAGRGIGRRLVVFLHKAALARGVVTTYLLTTTAEVFFHRFGYLSVDRTTLPSPVRASAEFATCEAADATAMKLILGTP